MDDMGIFALGMVAGMFVILVIQGIGDYIKIQRMKGK